MQVSLSLQAILDDGTNMTVIFDVNEGVKVWHEGELAAHRNNDFIHDLAQQENAAQLLAEEIERTVEPRTLIANSSGALERTCADWLRDHFS